MPVVFNALFIQLFLDRVVDHFCTSDVILRRVHSCPLERCKRLRNEKGGTDRDLASAVPLLLGNSVIIACRRLIGKLRDRPHIRLCLGRKSQHKVELDLIPAALKRHLGAV